MRTLTTPGGTWKYLVGSSFVKFFTPDGRSFVTLAHDVAGMTASAFDRGAQKATQDGMVTPLRVRAYIDSGKWASLV
jgi:hypothetical protein